MKNLIVTTALLSCFSIQFSFAQTQIKGKVTDENNNPVPFASIILLSLPDSSFLAGNLCNENGHFEVQIPAVDSFFLEISSLGFQELRGNYLTSGETSDLGSFTLRADSQTLGEITVTARKPFYEQRIDRTIVNVEGTVVSKSNSLLSVLSRSPSVRINPSSGDISLFGKQGVLLMIDNKPVRLERQDLISYLSAMPANQIATIELITSPPANYDAQGTAGVINITTIRNKDGFKGHISPGIGIGQRPKFSNSVNLSYHKNKLYVQTLLNTSLNYDLERVNILTQSESIGKSSRLEIERKPSTLLATGDFNLEYQINSKSTLGTLVSFLKSDWKMNALTQTGIENNSLNRSLLTSSYEINRLSRILYNLNFRQTFSNSFRLNFDLDYIDFTRENPTSYVVTEEGFAGKDQFRSNAVTPVKVTVFKTDAHMDLNNKANLEMGAKTSFSGFTNDVNVSNLIGNEWSDNSQFKNNFDLSEDIYAAYINLNWKPDAKITSKIGLRYEYYDLNLSSSVEGEIVNRSVGNLFPSLFFSYHPDESHTLNFSIVNRIQRPGFLILAPYFYFFDQNTLTTGNPEILPSRSNQFQLAYTHKNLTFTAQYNLEKTPILDFQPTVNSDLGIFEIKPIQGIQNKNLNISLNSLINFNRWWSLQLSGISYFNSQRFRIQETEYRRTRLSFETTAFQTFMISKKISAELSAAYFANNIYGTLDVIRRYQIDLGIRKKIYSDASLLLSITDVFNTGTQWPNRSALPNSDLAYYFNFDAEGPVFRLTLNLPLGKNTTNKESRDSGASEELKRVQ